MFFKILRWLFVMFSCILVWGCTQENSEVKKSVPISLTEDFAIVSIGESKENPYYVNEWLKANPNKKIVSISGVLAYREGISDYIIHFTPGDNSKQQCMFLSREKSRGSKHGLNALQIWKDSNPNVDLIFSTVPSYSGGVREFTICFEK